MVEIVINNGNEILTRLWNNVISRGVVNRRLDSSRLGLLLSAIASELNTTLSLIRSYMNQYTIATCTDKVMVENMARMFAVRRLSSKSKVIVEFYKLDENLGTIKIPAGFAIGSTTDSKIKFKTISDVYLWKGMQSVSVLAYSITSGKQNNVDAGVLNKFQSNGYNTAIAVINPEPAFGGFDDESVENLRKRATGFRYDRDGTEYNVKQLLYLAGVPQYRYNLQEHIDGPGTFLICLDATSDNEFEDVRRSFNYRHYFGIKPIFVRATRVYINIYVAIATTGQQDYTPLEKQQIYNNVNNRVQEFFAVNCVVGADLNVGRLQAAILSALSDFEIESVNLSFDQGVVVDDRRIINIPDTYRLFPNKIITDINYDGESIWRNEDADESDYISLYGVD